MTTPDTTETLEQIVGRIVNETLDPTHYAATTLELKRKFLAALRNEREARLILTEREKRVLIDHHNYEAEKAITRTGCRAIIGIVHKPSGKDGN